MGTVNQDLSASVGDDFSFGIAVLPFADGSPVNLTGATAEWELLSGDYAAADQLVAKAGPPGIFVDVPGAQIVVELDAVDTQNVAPGKYFHRCKLTLATGGSSTIASGAFALRYAGVP
jgi:hypothetical protein